MHLFTDYIQPLTNWLQVHPHLALLITFLISFTESLAVIGSIIPGSVTMTAIGILAGSGVMRIDLTFLAATLGAIAGDTGSYTLGYTFRDRLINIWPFYRYPLWLEYGRHFFEKHGATSILVGRFVGPMRSIIPVIAGMMHMNQWHFLVANIISAIGWALLYVLPGVLIGLASSELSPESATRLFVFILLFLVIIWFATLAIKWIFIHVNKLLRNNLHYLWLNLKQNPFFVKLATNLTPENEQNHYPTAALSILLLLCLALSITAVIFEDSFIATFNNDAYLFLQSLRTQSFDAYFIIVSLFTSLIPILTLFVTFSIYTLYYRDWRTFWYWLSLGLSTIIIVCLIEPKTQLLYPMPSFPALGLTVTTSLVGFLIFYINTYYRTVTLIILRIVLLVLLILAGLALVYLGDKSLTSVIASFLIGLTLCLFYWILYRRHSHSQRSQLLVVLSCLCTLVALGYSDLIYFKDLIRTHTPNVEQFVITEKVWWNQQNPLLPIYSTNRFGRPTGLLNVQYAGSMDRLVQALENHGWKPQSSSFFYSLLLRAGGNNSEDKIPLTAQIFLNRTPLLTMTYHLGKKKPLLILRLWRSNYHLRHYEEPIWIGSVIAWQPKKHGKEQPYLSISGHDYLIKALPDYKFNKIILPKNSIKPLSPITPRILLTIKEPGDHGEDDDEKGK